MAKAGRFRKNLVLAALPFIGFCFGTGVMTAGRTVRAAAVSLSIFLMLSAVRLFQDRGMSVLAGDQKPEIKDKSLAQVFLLASFALVFVFCRHVLFYWFLSFILSAGYFSDFGKLRQVPVLSTIIFFTLSLLMFSIGFGASAYINLNTFLFGIYFALIFSAGQLNGEVARANFDFALKHGSNALTFGKNKVSAFSFFLFTCGFVYLLSLIFGNVMSIKTGLPFILAYLIQLGIYIKLRKASDSQNAMVFQFSYRVIYAVACIVFFAMRLPFATS